ncbi:hypothetical protein DYB35_013077, partial [Aphanomyces astaci]
ADAIATHVFGLAQDLPDAAGTVFREFVATLAKKTAKNCWPDMRDLLLLRVALHVFPVTDLRHNVISPIELVLGQVRRSLSLQITAKKGKFMPELVHCLHEIVALVHSQDADDAWFVAPLKAFVKSKATTFPALALDAATDGLDAAAVSAAIFHSTLTTIRLAATQYASVASFVELFAPLHTLLSQIKAKSLKVQAEETLALLTKLTDASLKQRRPLRLQAHAPTVLPTFVPRFDENYAMRKDKTMERDKAQLKQLQRQVKRERKGASRELKRDAAFLSRQRTEEHNVWRAEKDAKQKEIRGWMEHQNATFNQQVRKGGELIKGGGSGPAKKRRISKK